MRKYKTINNKAHGLRGSTSVCALFRRRMKADGKEPLFNPKLYPDGWQRAIRQSESRADCRSLGLSEYLRILGAILINSPYPFLKQRRRL